MGYQGLAGVGVSRAASVPRQAGSDIGGLLAESDLMVDGAILQL